MIDSGRFIVIVCAVTAVMASMGYAAGAKIQALGLLSDTGDFSAADDISADGLVVVGHAGLTNNYEVFRWTEESGMVGLGISSGSRYRSLPKATSGDGSVIIGEGDNFRGFRWEEGIGMTGLGHLFTEGYGVFFDLTYDGSVMVGVHYHSPSDAIKVSAGGEVTVLAPPQAGIGAGATVVNSDGSVVAGGMVVGSNQYAARWTVGTGWISLGDLAGGSVYGAPEAMSSDGSVIVGLSDSSLGTQAFRWTKETGMNGLGFLSDSHNYSKANAISADGSIVVGQSQSASNAEAFIWTPEWGMRSLKDVLSDTYGLDVTGWYFSQAVGISADGTRIVGNGISPDGVNTAFLVTIPEPTVLSTLAIGIGWGLKRHS